MIGTLIGIIFLLIILGVLWYCAQLAMAQLPIAEPFKTLIYIVFVLLMLFIVLYVLSMILGMAGIHVPFPQGLNGR